MSLFANIDDYITVPEVEVEGVDLALGNGRFVTIRRAGGANEEFKVYSASKLKPYEDDMSRGTMDEDAAGDIMREIYARKIVIGWRGFKDAKGKDIPYTVENCIELFKSSNEIYKIVFDQSNNLNNFRQREVENSGNE